MSEKKFLVIYNFIRDGAPLPADQELWGEFAAENEAAAIELALEENYPEDEDVSSPAPHMGLRQRSREADRPYMHAMEKVAPLPSLVTLPIDKKAEQSFYDALGPELNEMVTISEEGITLDAFFTPEQFYKVHTAYAAFRAAGANPGGPGAEAID